MTWQSVITHPWVSLMCVTLTMPAARMVCFWGNSRGCPNQRAQELLSDPLLSLLRFMATSDLMSELQKDSIQLDEDSERKVVKMLLRLLEDKNGEVQNLAVKWSVSAMVGAGEGACLLWEHRRDPCLCGVQPREKKC